MDLEGRNLVCQLKTIIPNLTKQQEIPSNSPEESSISNHSDRVGIFTICRLSSPGWYGTFRRRQNENEKKNVQSFLIFQSYTYPFDAQNLSGYSTNSIRFTH